MAAPPNTHDPYAAFRSPGYRAYWIGNFVSVIGRQMLGFAIGYQIFQLTGSATALGFVGLAGALPVILLSLPAGQVADTRDRKSIVIWTQGLMVCTSAVLALLALKPDIVPAYPPLVAIGSALSRFALWCGDRTAHFPPVVPILYALLLLNGVARAFGWSARTPFMTGLVPRPALGNAVTWSSTNFEVGSMVGPAIGGLLVAQFSFPLVYAVDVLCGLTFILCLLPIRAAQEPHVPVDRPLHEFFSGLRFVWARKAILATITLDLFAVLLGGATALLPIFADEILHVGPVGLGWLRAAPSFGAIVMALALAHAPPMRKAGLTLLWSVTGFGIVTIIFGLSKSFWLSMLALVLAGAFDNVSVVVRHTLVQLLTPDSMRGRVAAVNNIFIGSSNELGALESGLTAARFGPILSVVGGGIGTILVVIFTAVKWPQVRKLGSLHAVDLEETDPQNRPS